MTEIESTASAAELLAELAGIRGRIEEAAREEDTIGWMEARMRADALPGLILTSRLEPLREELRALDARLDGLADELEGIRTREFDASEQQVTPAELRRRAMGRIFASQQTLGDQRRLLVARISDERERAAAQIARAGGGDAA